MISERLIVITVRLLAIYGCISRDACELWAHFERMIVMAERSSANGSITTGCGF